MTASAAAEAVIFKHHSARFHDLAAAAGDHITGLQMENFVTDGAVDIAFFLCPYYRDQSFHRIPFIKSAEDFPPHLGCFLLEISFQQTLVTRR